ncbi:MAG: ATP-binding protein [Pseudomonadota bacterium]
MNAILLKVEVKYEHDVVLARQRTRQIAQLLNFDHQEQVRLATAVSELARNAFQYANGGKIEFSLADDSAETPANFMIRITDQGPGIPHIEAILSGQYISDTGMGLGIVGAKRLVDDLTIDSTSTRGTCIQLTKLLPKNLLVTHRELLSITSLALSQQAPQNPFEEIQRQNQELLVALEEVQRQKQMLTLLNQELEETNCGVMALSGELEQRADYQRRSSELKTEFLSNITHELRTPLNSIISISAILMSRLDGELTTEQEKQVSFIQSSAKSLSELVNDVLDLAKVEAGKIVIRPRNFEIKEIFRILRGMLKPLVQSSSSVNLIFDDCSDIPILFTDEGKVSQILRNFISNSLKYTYEGEVRVSARMAADNTVMISVSDTGIGIAPEDSERIFEAFAQVEGDHQHKIRGTGLGLPLSRKLAHLLGGKVKMESIYGQGSTFSLILPGYYNGPQEAQYSELYAEVAPTLCNRILIIDDHPTDRYVLKKMLENYAEHIIEASSGEEGLALAEQIKPCVIFLDWMMPFMPGQEVLARLKQEPSTRDIPIIIHTSKTLSDQEQQSLQNQTNGILSKCSAQKSRAKELDRMLHELLSSQDLRILSYA